MRLLFCTLWIGATGLVCLGLCVPAAAVHTDRIDRRAQELALPDPLLDPAWPELAPAEGLPDAQPVPAEELPERGIESGPAGGQAAEGAAAEETDKGQSAGEIDELPLEDEDDGFGRDPEDW